MSDIKVLDNLLLAQLWQKSVNTFLVRADYLQTIYPIGSIYMSVNSTSPASLFGGTWEALNSGSVIKLPVDSNDFGVYAGYNHHTPLASKEQNPIRFIRSLGIFPEGIHNLYLDGTGMFYDSASYTYTDNNLIYPSNLYANENNRTHISVYMWKRTA